TRERRGYRAGRSLPMRLGIPFARGRVVSLVLWGKQLNAVVQRSLGGVVVNRHHARDGAPVLGYDERYMFLINLFEQREALGLEPAGHDRSFGRSGCHSH